MASSSRFCVLKMLDETTRKGRLSHLVTAEALKGRISGADQARERAFIMRLYNGTLERAVFLDYIIDSHCHNPGKIKPIIRNVLRMSIYQMLFMDSVPDRAAVNEAVKLAHAIKLSQLKGFINGILRSVQRDIQSAGGAGEYLRKTDSEVPSHVKYSVPGWMYDLLVKEYGRERSQAFLAAALKDEKPLCVRMVEIYAGRKEIIDLLTKDGCVVSEMPESQILSADERLLNITLGSTSITDLEAFKKGYIFIQDRGSVLAAEAGAEAMRQAIEDETTPLVVDVCAAPGGKTTYLAERFPKARVIARDISPEKTALIKENAQRLGLSNIETEVHNATETDPELILQADLVIADLPCSGLGTIGGKPDIRLRVKPEDIDSLASLQRQILSAVQGYVKPEGVLAYSTCTITSQENFENAQWFETNFPFNKISEFQLLPEDGTDGFYCAVFRKH